MHSGQEKFSMFVWQADLSIFLIVEKCRYSSCQQNSNFFGNFHRIDLADTIYHDTASLTIYLEEHKILL